MTDTPDVHPAAVLTDALRRAFHSAHYRFKTPDGELLLEINRCSDALRELLLIHGQACAAAITAYNPGSQIRDQARNLRAQERLECELQALGLPCFPGRHEDPQGQWPAETSTLVLGISCATASCIAARYGQLAIVWADATARPLLVEIGNAPATEALP